MYRPEGNVIPAYSTWQPTDGRIEPIAKADHSATRRLVDPRGDLIRGKTIASTLLGVSGGRSHPRYRGNQTAVGSPFLVPPAEPAGLFRMTERFTTEITEALPPRSGRDQSTIGRGRRVIYSLKESAGSTVSDQ
jgi:hypothetical protein